MADKQGRGSSQGVAGNQIGPKGGVGVCWGATLATEVAVGQVSQGPFVEEPPKQNGLVPDENTKEASENGKIPDRSTSQIFWSAYALKARRLNKRIRRRWTGGHGQSTPSKPTAIIRRLAFKTIPDTSQTEPRRKNADGSDSKIARGKLEGAR